MNPLSILRFNRCLLGYLFSRLIIYGIFVIFIVNGLQLFFIASNEEDSFSDFYDQLDTTNTVIFGTSHTRAFYMPALGRYGYSLSGGLNDVYSSYTKYSIVEPYIKNLNMILFSISPGYLSFDRSSDYNTYARYRLLADGVPPLKYHPRIPLKEYMLLKATEYDIFSSLNYSVRDSLMKATYRLLNPITSANVCTLAQYDYQMPAKPECIEYMAESTIMSHQKAYKTSSKDAAEIRRKNVNKILMLADHIKEKGGCVVLITPPFTKEYYEHPIVQGWATLQDHYIAKLTAHPNIYYLDFHDFFYSSGYQRDNHYFSDDDHLSFYGAKIFSSHLKEELKSLEGTLR